MELIAREMLPEMDKHLMAAPEANLIGVKVLNSTGSGSLQTIMQGIEWCIQYNEIHPGKKIHVLSMHWEQNRNDMKMRIRTHWCNT